MAYAQDTNVAIEKTQADIAAIVRKYRASAFGHAWDDTTGQAMVQFKIADRHVRFMLSMPSPNEQRFHRTEVRNMKRSNKDALKHWDQACRARWRALYLVIKAKLEAVESGISVVDQEFMAHIVMPNGRTVGEDVIPKIAHAYETGDMPPLLPGPQ